MVEVEGQLLSVVDKESKSNKELNCVYVVATPFKLIDWKTAADPD